jgi:V/A-type H+-transporting ATPase subunit F
MEVAIVGNDDFVTGFALAGVRYTFTAETNLDERVEEALRHDDIGVLVMEEEQFKSLNTKTRKMLSKLVKPVVVLISEKGGEADIRGMIKRSLGVDLWR